MKDKYTKKAKYVLEQAQTVSQNLNHSYIGTEHILVGLLSVEDCTASIILRKHKVELEKVMELIETLVAPIKPVAVCDHEIFTPRAKNILNNSVLYAEKTKDNLVGTEHILLALIKEREGVATRLLNTLGINLKSVYIEVLETMGVDLSDFKDDIGSTSKMKESRKNNSKSALEQFSVDLTNSVQMGTTDPVIGRESEIDRVIQILSRRTKNNPCLVGEPGVGKTAIVEAIAKRIVDNNVPDTLSGKRLLTLDLPSMVAGSKYRGEFEERIKKVINEVKTDGNTLLFLDEIHTIIGAGGAEGSIDAANILKPALARGEIQIIGATTMNEYRKYFEKDAALERRFQPVTVEEPTIEETEKILEGLRTQYEKHHGVTISDDAIRAAAKMSARYVNDRFLPDKAIDLIDEACSKVKLSTHQNKIEHIDFENEIEELEQKKLDAIRAKDFKLAGEIKKEQEIKKNKYQSEKNRIVNNISNTKSKGKHNLIVDENEIAQVIAMWTKIPVSKLTEKESQKLKRLEATLKKRVVGQDEAVHLVSNAIRRGRVGLKDPKRPIGSFLFLGPTGVGKTELSKALAASVFGSEQAMIRVDMSEYMEKHSVSKLIGSPPGYVGYEDGGQLSERVRRNPYSVVLFDEIEKAHPDVFNILLQILDEGHITDNNGRKINFKNTVIIMTSNVGASRIIEPKRLGFETQINEKENYDLMKKGVMEEIKQLFRPELLNRIDEIIVFRSLLKEDMKSIVNIMLADVCNRAKEQLNISLKITSSAKNYIIDNSFDKKYGARPMRRKIQTLVEDKLAEEIIAGNVKNGDIVNISVSEKKLKFVTIK